MDSLSRQRFISLFIFFFLVFAFLAYRKGLPYYGIIISGLVGGLVVGKVGSFLGSSNPNSY